MFRILFVCTGNTCRSPMAEAMLKEIVRRKGKSDKIRIFSAGTDTYSADQVSDGARVAMAKRGLNLDGHYARQLLPTYLQVSDVVLTMAKSHKDRLLELVPEIADKVFTLAEYAGENRDIEDPFGGDVETYERCAADIEQLLNFAWKRIAKSAGKK